MNIYEKLAAVQSELKAPKGQYNSFGKYNYRSCEDILEVAKPLCIKHGLVLTLSDEMVEVGGRVYVKATAGVIEIDGEKGITATANACEPPDKKGMDSSQITGAASSYARKYALNGLFAIDDAKDADTDEHAAQAKAEPVVCPKCGKEVKPVKKADGTIVPPEKVLAGWGCCAECQKKKTAGDTA